MQIITNKITIILKIHLIESQNFLTSKNPFTRNPSRNANNYINFNKKLTEDSTQRNIEQ